MVMGCPVALRASIRVKIPRCSAFGIIFSIPISSVASGVAVKVGVSVMLGDADGLGAVRTDVVDNSRDKIKIADGKNRNLVGVKCLKISKKWIENKIH